MPRDLFEDIGENGARQSSPKDLFEDMPEHSESEKGFLRNAVDYEKALGLGLAQGAGDTLASIGNWPSELIKHFTGKQLYQIPHPSLQQYYPQGNVGSVGSTVGETVGSLAAPGGIAFKALKIFNNPLAKALAGGVAGGLTGAATDEEDRLGSGIAGATLGAGLPLAAASGKLAKNIITGFTPRKAADILQKKYNASSQLLSKGFNEIGKEATSSRISKIPLNKKIFDEISNAVGGSETFENLLNKAKSGEYKELRDLQSELWTRGNKALKSPLISEQNQGEKLHQLRDKINQTIASHFVYEGKPELAEKLYENMAGYKKLKDTYNTHPTISKVVGNQQKVPKNLVGTLYEDSAIMKKIMADNPELSNKLKSHTIRNKIGKAIKLSAIGGLGYEGYKGLKELLG
jgi:hypothetical protein